MEWTVQLQLPNKLQYLSHIILLGRDIFALQMSCARGSS